MLRRWLVVCLALSVGLLVLPATGDDKKPNSGDMIDLPLELPKPQFKETPRNPPPGLRVEKPREGARPPMKVPAGVVNLALKKPVTSSDKDPVIGTLDLVTDGDKEANEGSKVELARGVQWVQIDLGKTFPLYAIAIWHYHGQARVYNSVIVQVSDDPDFIKGVTTLYNNDHENAVGLGVGEDLGYWESNEGKLVDAKGTKARYVRCYSNGNTTDDQNQYIEVEVWGLPK